MNIDSSGSMSSTDPYRLRVDAAKSFSEKILGMDSNSLFSIYDFGAGSNGTYKKTRQLTTDWTSNKDTIATAIDLCKESGSTPLYESTGEILDSFNTQISSTQYERAMLVLSDGAPSDSSYRTATISKSLSYGIPINTVLLGSNSTSYYNTMKQIALDTGGIFTSASDASDLADAFKNITLGTTEGYITYDLVFPDLSDKPLSYSSFTLDIKVSYGGESITKTIDFN
ncbi:MAG: VWA domain-containing protein [Spirochaetales bacterium]|nr:VWA domain-containing protein [Spirochaetales bacterium]